MGRLPKGFKKTMAPGKHDEKAEEAIEAQAEPSSSKAGPAAATAPAQRKSAEHAPNPRFLKDETAASGSSSTPKQQTKQHQAPAPAAAASDGSEEEAEGAAPAGHESKGQMIQRHKRELQAFKKNLPRMGKKSKDEVAKLTAEMEAKHAKELADLEASTAAPSPAAAPAAEVDAAQVAMAQLQVDGDADGADAEHGGGGKMTKAMKRRQKQQAAEAEREARIAAEAAEAGPSARAQEEEALFALLTPLGLRMREIRADGHCLYRSLEDQLSLDKAAAAGANGVMDFQQLRTAAAKHIRSHPDQYIHYMDMHDDESGEQALERYCDELENTAVWGGQLELSVLAQVLQRPIKVYTVGLPALTLGEEFVGGKEPLQVCYLRHAFGLGEHYNSLEPAPA